MVKRYASKGLIAADKGEVVFYEDYLSLQAALREALERWTELHDDFVAEGKIPNRVQQLREQFLDI